MRKTLAASLFLAFCLPLAAKNIPADAWQTGTLTDSSESWHTRGGGAMTGNQYGVHGAMGSHEYPIVQYTIDAGAYVFQVNLVLHNDREKHPAVTIKAPIKFAIDEKADFYIQDERGKRYKLVIDKKTLK